MMFKNEEIKLLNGSIPKYERVKPSFVSILKAHSETNLTNFLAYLLKGEDFPQLQEIFLQALIDCIVLGPHDDNFLKEMLDEGYAKINVYSEYQTKFGRIDILIVKESDRQSERSAIIVENKLYHELNNDFDDYFYSVCENENILPKNVAVTVLSLKSFQRAFPNYMKTSKVLHKELKIAIEEELNKKRSLLNDKSASLLIYEYLMHIDDLYLERAIYSNEKSFEFYFNNKSVINSIVKKVEGLSFGDFESKDFPVKKMLYDLRDKIRQTSQLQKDIIRYATDSFNHYIILTERAVQGKDYFRGGGLAYAAIRYKLNFKNHFIREAQIELEVWLNGSFLSKNNITISESKFQTVLSSLSVSLPVEQSNTAWYKISTDYYEIDSSILMNILLETIESKWGAFEIILAESIQDNLIQNFNQQVTGFLNQKGFDSKLIEDGKAVQFAWSTTERFYQYSIKLSPPDLIEIILFVENTFWKNINEKLLTQEGFIKFTEVQSYRIKELEHEGLFSESLNYDAILKKSYRIDSLDDVLPLLTIEKPIWAEVENKIVEIIGNSSDDEGE